VILPSLGRAFVADAIRKALDRRAHLQESARKERLRELTFPPPLPPVESTESIGRVAVAVRALVEALATS
jgi:hypothetical protein